MSSIQINTHLRRSFSTACLLAWRPDESGQQAESRQDEFPHPSGFGGLIFCRRFHHPRARITVVDRTNHHLFQPLLYQVAMAGLAAPDIAQLIRSVLSKHPELEVFLDEVRQVDVAAKRVIC